MAKQSNAALVEENYLLIMEHLEAWSAGHSINEETGIHHLAHVANICMNLVVNNSRPNHLIYSDDLNLPCPRFFLYNDRLCLRSENPGVGGDWEVYFIDNGDGWDYVYRTTRDLEECPHVDLEYCGFNEAECGVDKLGQAFLVSSPDVGIVYSDGSVRQYSSPDDTFYRRSQNKVEMWSP